MAPIIWSQIRYDCGGKENVPPLLEIKSCSSTFLLVTLNDTIILHHRSKQYFLNFGMGQDHVS